MSSTPHLDDARPGATQVTSSGAALTPEASVPQGRRRRIVVGQLPSGFEVPPDDPTEMVHANSFREVFPLLWKTSHVELLIAETDPALRKWQDLVELVASKNIQGELRIIGHEGQQVFRGTIRPRNLRTERTGSRAEWSRLGDGR